jgi:glutathione synthase/RimK-type ligase-like ATP-grasp enzyme
MPDRNPARIALVSARIARNRDDDQPPLEAAFRSAGADVRVADWDDEAVDWGAYDLAVLRSAWDYTLRYAEFLAWAERAASLTTLLNPLPVIRWNTDKHYLLDLERAQVPIISSQAIGPGENVAAAVDRFLATHDQAELVVKPTIGAGARDAQRHDRTNRASIAAHAQRLLDEGRSVLFQPYLAGVEQHGESALIFFSGRFSHSIRKGPLLQRGAGSSQSLFAEEQISPRTPAPDELRVAEQALAAIPFSMPLYARVDLIRNSAGAPQVLEIELTEPSLFLAHAPGSATRFADAVLLAGRSRL